MVGLPCSALVGLPRPWLYPCCSLCCTWQQLANLIWHACEGRRGSGVSVAHFCQTHLSVTEFVTWGFYIDKMPNWPKERQSSKNTTCNTNLVPTHYQLLVSTNQNVLIIFQVTLELGNWLRRSWGRHLPPYLTGSEKPGETALNLVGVWQASFCTAAACLACPPFILHNMEG